MNLYKMAMMQIELDKHITNKHNLHNKDLYTKRKVALLVELGELANELRFFKFWSEDQKPRFFRICHECRGGGVIDMGHHVIDCYMCKGVGHDRHVQPVLEEYVDGLHFILSLIVQHPKYQNITKLRKLFDNVSPLHYVSLEDQFMALYYEISGNAYSQMSLVLRYYLGLGKKLLGFTDEEIEAHYKKKHSENYDRQAKGY